VKRENVSIIYLEEVDSTQKYLIEKIKKNEINTPVCVWTDLQTDGVGSRGNRWQGGKGNLFFSFAYEKNSFDVPLQSMSIYFGWIFKKTLNSLGSGVVMKWPNDIYLIENGAKKIGGIITNMVRNVSICGIGLNTVRAPSIEFGCLDIDIKNDKILKSFFSELEKYPSWESVIEEYKKEFLKTAPVFYKGARLRSDGSLEINGKRVYSKR